MKKITFILIAILSIGLTVSCGNSSNKKQDTHAHDDGSVHEAHGTEEVAKPAPAQESFKVEADTTKVQEPVKKAHDHDHAHDSDHKH